MWYKITNNFAFVSNKLGKVNGLAGLRISCTDRQKHVKTGGFPIGKGDLAKIFARNCKEIVSCETSIIPHENSKSGFFMIEKHNDNDTFTVSIIILDSKE